MRVITGTERGRKLEAPKGLDVRPTSEMTKEAIFSILLNRIEGAVFLDLFSGTGQMGIEALSRGAKQAILIDSSKTAIECIKSNIQKTSLFPQCRVALMDSLSFLKSCRDKIDIAFVDPPYKMGIIDEALPLLSKIMDEQGIILCETDKNEVLPDEAGEFVKFKEYKYGKTKVTSYCKGDKE
ncbi:MAG: 16S rRNA (guanine(966)-N(2))-methyltransferase RsmD [Oscillospiraceae bacterium]